MTATQVDLKLIRLDRPTLKYKASYLAALSEMQTNPEKSAWVYLGESEPHDTPVKNFEKYVATLRSTETQALPGFGRTHAIGPCLKMK